MKAQVLVVALVAALVAGCGSTAPGSHLRPTQGMAAAAKKSEPSKAALAKVERRIKAHFRQGVDGLQVRKVTIIDVGVVSQDPLTYNFGVEIEGVDVDRTSSTYKKRIGAEYGGVYYPADDELEAEESTRWELD